MSTAGISALFLIWSLTGLLLEVPTGAWADAVSRRLLLATGAIVRGCGFALWTLWPAYPSFALGFVLWGIGGSLWSGTADALLYDELAGAGRAERYLGVAGRAATWATVATMIAAGLAGPALAAGGYALVGWASVGVSLAVAPLALALPEHRAPRARATAPPVVPPVASPARPPDIVPEAPPVASRAVSLVASARLGVREAIRPGPVRRFALLAAALPALSAVEEYGPLLARDQGAAAALVPALTMLVMGAMAAGAAWAARSAGAGRARWGGVLLAAAVLLAWGASAGHPYGMVGLAGCLGLLRWAELVNRARLQRMISGPARATVLSVAEVGAEIGSLGIFAVFGLAGTSWSMPTLLTASAVPVAVAGVLALVTPGARRDGPARDGDRRCQ